MRRTTTVAWCLLGCVTMGWAQDATVPLTTEIPEEILAGTPPDVLALLFPHLEKPPEGPPPEFLVPAGTVNLARGKPVTASDRDPVLGELSYVNDGRKEGSASNYMELPPGTQWIQIDLSAPCEIFAVYLWHFFREARSYHDVIVLVANDPKFAQQVQTVYNNDQDNSSGMGMGRHRPYIETFRGRLIDAQGVVGRYVRVYSAGNTANNMNHYIEVEVFGRPAPETGKVHVK